MTASYSSGKGLDFHRYLIEASQDPTLFNQDIERFYYSSYYGVRVSVKPVRGLRLSVSRQESRQNDLGIVNHTWRFGASAWNLLGQGLSFVGNYALNRGDLSESDSYYVSLAKDFGRFSLERQLLQHVQGGALRSGHGGARADLPRQLSECRARHPHPTQPRALGLGRVRRIPPDPAPTSTSCSSG